MITHSQYKLSPKSLKIISLVCASLVPILVTGPFLPDLLVTTMSIWFLYYTLKNKIYYIYRNIYFYFFLGFWLICILSSLLSDSILFSLKASFFYIRIAIFALLIFYLIEKNKKILDYFYYSFLITYTSLIIDGYFQYFTNFNLFGYPLIANRVSSFFGSELILGSFLTRLFPLLFSLFIIRPNKHPLEVYFISLLFILIDILIFLAGERASFVLLNLSTFFVILFISNYKKLRIATFIISILIIIVLGFNNKKLVDRYISSPIESMNLKHDDKYIFTQVHDSLIKTAWKMFLDKPILGHGPKLFRIKCSDPKYATGNFPCDVHPHNFYIQLLSETGIIGFLFLVGLFFYLIFVTGIHVFKYFIHKKKFLSDYQIGLLSGLLITVWPLIPNGNLFTNHLMIMYGLQMGFFKKTFNRK
jgi:O-antigen ligase